MDLRACPFCGGAAELHDQIVADEAGREVVGYRVICQRCKALGPWGADTGLKGQINAQTSWNQRV